VRPIARNRSAEALECVECGRDSVGCIATTITTQVLESNFEFATCGLDSAQARIVDDFGLHARRPRSCVLVESACDLSEDLTGIAQGAPGFVVLGTQPREASFQLGDLGDAFV
jgi:hypothetical protein